MKWSEIYNNFNSIKVRLEPYDDEHIPLFSLFQFHKGTIRTEDRSNAEERLWNFNSIKVRLELCPADTLYLGYVISIP